MDSKTSREYLYYITSDDQAEKYWRWYDDFKGQYVCAKCLHLKPEYRIRAFDIHLAYHPGKAALYSIFPPFIEIVRTEFLDVLGEEAKSCLNFGRVYIKEGRLLDDYVTYASERFLSIRGSKKSTYHGPCELCGDHRYTSKYPWYVLRQSLFQRPIYVSWKFCDLIVNEYIVSRIDRRKWKGIQIYKMPILDEPRDGVTALPTIFPVGASDNE